MGDSFFSLINLVIGAYLLYSAITGSGRLYQNENIKKGMEAQYKKRLRIMAFILSPFMLAQSAIDYFYPDDANMRAVSFALYVVSLIAVVALFIISYRMTDRTKSSARKPGSPGQKSAPRSAFEFDDEETDKKESGE